MSTTTVAIITRALAPGLYEVRRENGRTALVRGLFKRGTLAAQAAQAAGLDRGPEARWSRPGWCVCTARVAKAWAKAHQGWADKGAVGRRVRIIERVDTPAGWNQGFGSGASDWKAENAHAKALREVIPEDVRGQLE